MRKLIMWNLISLDGCFDGAKPWDLDFHTPAWGEEMEKLCLEQLRQTGGLLFGRATYQGMASYWTTATGAVADFMNSVPKVVFSNTLDEASWNNSRLIKGEAADAVAALKKEDGKDLFVFGSGKLSDALLRRDLFD